MRYVPRRATVVLVRTKQNQTAGRHTLSAETYEHLNTQTLIGFTSKRGNAWHYRANLQGDEPNHYPTDVPVADVLRRLFHWTPEVGPAETTIAGKRYVDHTRKVIVRPDTETILGTFKSTYQVHRYDEWLLDNVAAITDSGELKIGSAGLLKGGAVAWVQFELEETLDVANVQYRPFLTAATSLDGSIATTYQCGHQVVVCHEKGTQIIDGAWRGNVEDHPSAVGPYTRDGFKVAVRGLPFTESVTAEHRYWVRERRVALTPKRREQLGVASQRHGQDKTPAWVEARDLTPVIHEIGYRIDQTVVPVPDEFDDTGTAYLMGYWLGNGNIHSQRQYTLSVPTSKPALIDDLLELVSERTGRDYTPTARPGCVQFTVTDPALTAEFARWKREGWAQKPIPAWVETAPLDWQSAFVRGYYDADGVTDTTHGCILTSVSMDALLSVRRILMRLGVPSSIRAGSDPVLHQAIEGRKVNAQQTYTLRFWSGAEVLGYVSRHNGRPIPYIEDGFLWSRVDAVEATTLDAVPITTKSHDYSSAFGLSHNCDNTLSGALREKEANRVKIRHSKHSLGQISNVRDALGLVYESTDAFAAEIESLTSRTVSEVQWQKFLDEYTGRSADLGGKAVAHARRRADELDALWKTDERVAPWAGTAWGVLAATNTHLHHVSTVRGADRVTRNTERMVLGMRQIEASGVKTLKTLAAVTG